MKASLIETSTLHHLRKNNLIFHNKFCLLHCISPFSLVPPAYHTWTVAPRTPRQLLLKIFPRRSTSFSGSFSSSRGAKALWMSSRLGAFATNSGPSVSVLVAFSGHLGFGLVPPFAIIINWIIPDLWMEWNNKEFKPNLQCTFHCYVDSLVSVDPYSHCYMCICNMFQYFCHSLVHLQGG